MRYIVFPSRGKFNTWQNQVWLDFLDRFQDKEAIKNGRIIGRNASNGRLYPNKRQTDRFIDAFDNPAKNDQRVLTFNNPEIPERFTDSSAQEQYDFEIVDEQFAIDNGWLDDNK